MKKNLESFGFRIKNITDTKKRKKQYKQSKNFSKKRKFKRINNDTTFANKYYTRVGNITISSHAVLRYLERVENININLIRKNKHKLRDGKIVRYLETTNKIDIQQIKQAMITDKIKDLVNILGGNGVYPNKTFRLVMQNYNVITIKI